MPCGHLNAMRFAQKPLNQPAYAFCHIPQVHSTFLQDSIVQRIDNREHFQACMAEMLLLGKEAVRRRAHKKNATATSRSDVVVTNSAAKPLSLEYLADRMDVDDPCFGFLVRTKQEPNNNNNKEKQSKGEVTEASQQDEPRKDVTAAIVKSPTTTNSHWKEGMLQGFITVTTFTNWQATFQWDSLHPDAFQADPPALQKQMRNVRQWDVDGSLALELQSTVHSGDVWNEGIVWPRIAEISLLGGLGCGRTLVKLALEQLERLKASECQNYDYVVLQATDNSIPFYESLGFVRVGGIMEDKNTASEEKGNEAPDGEAGSPASTESSQEPRSEIITSDITTYATKKKGETPMEIAKKLRVNVWDILFLNRGIFQEAMTPNSKLILGTTLQVPAPKKKERTAPTRVSSRAKGDENINSGVAEGVEEEPTWYIAKENDTPTQIARKFKVNCQELIRANANRLPGLMGKSRLRNGSRVQVSHFHIRSKKWMPYSHWSFPDNEVEDGEPSYMMCYKLQRGTSPTKPSIAESLQTEIVDYTPTPLLWRPEQPEAATSDDDRPASATTKAIQRKSLEPILEAASKSTEEVPSTSVLLIRDTNRDSHGLARVVSDGQPVQHSPMTSRKTLSKDTNDTAETQASELKPPKRFMSSFVLFCQDMRKRKAQLLEGLSIADASRVLADRWQKAPPQIKQDFEKKAAKGKEEYLIQKEEYERLLAIENAKQQRRDSVGSTFSDRDGGVLGQLDEAGKKKKDHAALYNRIVKVKPEAVPFTVTPKPKAEPLGKDGEKLSDPTSSPELQPEYYKYWFVLTYIPDLQWCHLVPLVRVGEFTPEDKKARLVGRPKWKLVDESLCQEIDISSRYVVPVKSRETKRSADADKEEWDIRDQDEEDTSSEEGSRSSGRKSTGGKRGKKRSKPSSDKFSRGSKKRAYQNPFLAGPTPKSGADPDQSSSIEGANCKWLPPQQVTLPPMNLDMSALKPTILHHGSGQNVSESSDQSEAPASPVGRYAQSEQDPNPHHPPYGYVGHHPYHQRDPHHGHYAYPPSDYYYSENHHMGPPPQYQQHYQHPPPGWPEHVPFPPRDPYPQSHRHQHYEGGPPPHHDHGQQHYPDHRPPQGYEASYPAQVPPVIGTPSCKAPSVAHLGLSVERECAI